MNNNNILSNYEIKKNNKLRVQENLSKKNSLNLIAKIFLGMIVVVLVSFLYLWQVSTLNTYRTRVSSLNRQKKEIEREITNLNVIAAKLSSLDRIKRIAEEELNMIKSHNIEYIEGKF
ncbi:MAG: hypothetical protein ACQESP_03475 [Candidatus Muiribacteriota bacterium]